MWGFDIFVRQLIKIPSYNDTSVRVFSSYCVNVVRDVVTHGVIVTAWWMVYCTKNDTRKFARHPLGLDQQPKSLMLRIDVLFPDFVADVLLFVDADTSSNFTISSVSPYYIVSRDLNDCTWYFVG